MKKFSTIFVWMIFCFFTLSFANNEKEIPLVLTRAKDDAGGVGGGGGGGGSGGAGRGGMAGAGRLDKPKGGHHTHIREGNREKHENADARRQKEQRKAQEKREKNRKKR